jgi:RNA polymerase sigma-70 factor, ECF subfamily
VLRTVTDAVDNRPSNKSVSRPMAMEKDDELALIAKARQGDSDAYSRLVLANQDRIYASVLRHMRDEHKAMDVTQEAFIQAYRAIDTYEDRARFSTWLYRIAMNLITSHYRHEGAQKRGGSKHETSLNIEGMPEPGADQRTPDDMVAAGDIGVQVRAAIDELEDEYRDVVVMRDLQDLSYEEIAETLRIAPGTVRSRLHRGREKLKEKLKHLM